MSPRFENIATCSTMSSTSANDMSRLYQLEQLLLRKLPESVHMLNICIIAIQKRFPTTAHVEFYAYLEDEDETWPRNDKDEFIVCIQRPNFHAKKGVIVFPPSKPSREMTSAFDTLVGWDEPQVFQSIPDPFRHALGELCKLHNNLKPEDNKGIPGIVLAVSNIDKWRNSNKTPCKTNLTLRKLEQKDIAEVAENWHWGQDHSEQTMRETIGLLASCGGFSESGEMVSSVLMSALGFFNVLFTPEKFRRKGYGQLVLHEASKMAVEELGAYPAAEIEVWNEVSKKTMENVGYEEAFRSNWFYFYPATSEQ